jgi:hypothetical protein
MVIRRTPADECLFGAHRARTMTDYLQTMDLHIQIVMYFNRVKRPLIWPICRTLKVIFSTLKTNPSTLKIILSTLKMISSNLKTISSTLKMFLSTLKMNSSTLKLIFSTLKPILSTLKRILSTLKMIPRTPQTAFRVSKHSFPLRQPAASDSFFKEQLIHFYRRFRKRMILTLQLFKNF